MWLSVAEARYFFLFVSTNNPSDAASLTDTTVDADTESLSPKSFHKLNQTHKKAPREEAELINVFESRSSSLPGAALR